MRKYQPIWLAIKKHNTARLAAPVSSHRQIILAVRKEKTGDLAWKLENLEAGCRWKLLHKVDGKVITFTLAAATLISYATLTPNDL
jgi:hypothetical protein